jgi:hypothetical protein
MVVKKEKEEVSTSAMEITALALAVPRSNMPPQGIIELSDDESEDLIASTAATVGADPSEARPSTPRVPAVPNTSGDWEFARKLFVDLNWEAIGIPDDGALVDLVSNEEEAVEDDASEGKKEVTPGDKVEEGTVAIDGSPEQAVVPPSPPPSA